MNDAQKKILLVDDDEDLRKLLGIILDISGYEIFHAAHGEDAKEQLKTLAPDLIILDMMMPVMDGVGFLRWLRQEAKQETPVLALTGRAKPHTETLLRELGASKILFKPTDPEKIAEHAKEILENDSDSKSQK